MTTTTPDVRTTRTRAWRAAGVVGVATAADVAMDPSRTHVPLCPFHAVTGAWCPLCGGLRAVSSLAHGNVAAAVNDNLLVVAGIPIACAVWLLAVTRPQHRVRLDRRAWFAIIAVAVVFTIVRNLSFGAF